MNIKSSRLLLEDVIAEHPQLLNELVERNRPSKSKERMEPQVIRMPPNLKVRIDVLVEKCERKQADIIRDALEIGVSRMEEDAG